MQAGNTSESYGWVAVALHWIVAIGVLMMFFIGIQAGIAGIAGEAGDRELRGTLMGYHIAWGATLILFVIARVLWRYTQPQPVKPPQAGWLNLLATITQHLLILAIVVQFISGPLAVWSGGRDINVWGLFAIPTPFAERKEGVHEFAEVLHLIGRVTIFFVLPLHILGALKHVIIDRDGAFMRMITPGAKLKAKG